jgi:hypothetical protein
MPIMETTSSSRTISQIRPRLGLPVRHRIRIHDHELELPALGTTRIGRSRSCAIVIDHPAISREHTELIVRGARVVVRDLGSRNGTWVDGERIAHEIELEHGGRLRFGSVDAELFVSVTPAPMPSTLRLRACLGCGMTFEIEERACPRCKAPTRDEDWPLGHDVMHDVIPTLVDETRRRSWWLELHVDLVERALSLWRLDDAQRGLQRIEDAIAERGDDVDAASLDRAFDVAIRLSVAQGDTAWIRWVLDTQAATERVPSRALVDRLRALPPILMEDARPALQRLTEVVVHAGDHEAIDRLEVLRGLHFDVEKLRVSSA